MFINPDSPDVLFHDFKKKIRQVQCSCAETDEFFATPGDIAVSCLVRCNKEAAYFRGFRNPVNIVDRALPDGGSVCLDQKEEIVVLGQIPLIPSFVAIERQLVRGFEPDASLVPVSSIENCSEVAFFDQP